MIAEYEVTNHNTSQGLLTEVVQGAKETLEVNVIKTVADKGYKTVSFGPDTEIVPVKIYGNAKYKVAQLPPGFTLYNSFYRKDDIPKKVLLRIRPDKDKIKQGMCLSEHPFGTVKWYDGAHYLLSKGKEKTTGELGLSFLAYNLKRAINVVGAARLLAAIRA